MEAGKFEAEPRNIPSVEKGASVALQGFRPLKIGRKVNVVNQL